MAALPLDQHFAGDVQGDRFLDVDTGMEPPQDVPLDRLNNVASPKMGVSESSRLELESSKSDSWKEAGRKTLDLEQGAGQSKRESGHKRLRNCNGSSSLQNRERESQSKPSENGDLQSYLSRAQEHASHFQERAAYFQSLAAEREREMFKLQQQLLQMKQSPSAQSYAQSPISDQELKQAYCNSVQSLKDYVSMSNLMSYDITGKLLPEKIVIDLKMLIHQISKVCLQVIKPETPVVLELISKDFTMATTTDWELDRSHWINVIVQLKLTDEQVLSILKSRELHVATILSLYQERAVLCRQSAEIAMKSSTTSLSVLGGGHEDNSNMGVLMRHGYLYCARNMVALHRVLELIKDNLQKEQRAIMELFLKVVYQTLSPIQAALFVVESFPYHCDVLALANVLSSVVLNDSTTEGNSGNTQPAVAGLNSQLEGLPKLRNSQLMQQGMNNSSSAALNLSGEHNPLGSLLPGGGNTLSLNGLSGGSLSFRDNTSMPPSLGGGDADMVASWLQMQGGGDPLDPRCSMPGDGMSSMLGVGGQGESVDHLKKFLEGNSLMPLPSSNNAMPVSPSKLGRYPLGSNTLGLDTGLGQDLLSTNLGSIWTGDLGLGGAGSQGHLWAGIGSNVVMPGENAAHASGMLRNGLRFGDLGSSGQSFLHSLGTMPPAGGFSQFEQGQSQLALSSHGGNAGRSFLGSGNRGLQGGQGSLSLEQSFNFKGSAGLGLGSGQQQQFDGMGFAGQSASPTIMGGPGSHAGMLNGVGKKNCSPGLNPLLAVGGGGSSGTFGAVTLNRVGSGELSGQPSVRLGISAGLSMSRQGSNRAGTVPGLDLSGSSMSEKVRH
ncbi:hypothetical protein CEUSTIGMA_g12001.t1 [Chlamydomonas eustigma]|uniref:Uncharacterized protein n=1 Tax=Chlamydomonas eustigma TaxID=1157962 RepID=A0A250XP56_9CHLO|nr:hypothetical protein CEUSTIGMA_g12001.t1 [Chlamydomonas eustigma]|eukprot:GAX84580.1 hypothetical protein CEUSTIGMA_g12001.t1 [Chlamydomonas eustigma]